MAPAPLEEADRDLGLQQFVRQRVRKLRRNLRKRASKALGNDPTALHRLRIAAKRLRYALEFFAPVLPVRTVSRKLRHFAQVQTELGFLNDFSNALRLLSDCSGDDAKLREASALVAGWHGTRRSDILAQLPETLVDLLGQRSL